MFAHECLMQYCCCLRSNCSLEYIFVLSFVFSFFFFAYPPHSGMDSSLLHRRRITSPHTTLVMQVNCCLWWCKMYADDCTTMSWRNDVTDCGDVLTCCVTWWWAHIKPTWCSENISQTLSQPRIVKLIWLPHRVAAWCRGAEPFDAHRWSTKQGVFLHASSQVQLYAVQRCGSRLKILILDISKPQRFWELQSPPQKCLQSNQMLLSHFTYLPMNFGWNCDAVCISKTWFFRSLMNQSSDENFRNFIKWFI